jgi:hypothetical protein
MQTGRIGHTATRLKNGSVLIAGGIRPGFGKFPAEVEIYLPRSKSFQLASPLISPRIAHASVLLRDGHVLILGGAADIVLSSAEIY